MTDYAKVYTMDKKEAEEKGLYQVIGKDIDDPYIEALKSQVIPQDAIDAEKDQLKIV